MAHFTAKPVLEDLGEFDEWVFGNARTHLRRELDAFVKHFDASHPEASARIGPETLANAYVQLSGCSKHLQSASEKQAMWTELSRTGRDTLARLQDADQVLQDIEQQQANKGPPFAVERAEFLAQLEAERKAVDKEMQHQKDKIDEYYAKKTRESTYRNLVGAKQPWV